MHSSEGRYRAMLAVVGVIALAVVASAVVLWPRGELTKPGAGGQADSTHLATGRPPPGAAKAFRHGGLCWPG